MSYNIYFTKYTLIKYIYKINWIRVGKPIFPNIQENKSPGKKIRCNTTHESPKLLVLDLSHIKYKFN